MTGLGGGGVTAEGLGGGGVTGEGLGGVWVMGDERRGDSRGAEGEGW